MKAIKILLIAILVSPLLVVLFEVFVAQWLTSSSLSLSQFWFVSTGGMLAWVAALIATIVIAVRESKSNASRKSKKNDVPPRFGSIAVAVTSLMLFLGIPVTALFSMMSPGASELQLYAAWVVAGLIGALGLHAALSLTKKMASAKRRIIISVVAIVVGTILILDNIFFLALTRSTSLNLLFLYGPPLIVAGIVLLVKTLLRKR